MSERDKFSKAISMRFPIEVIAHAHKVRKTVRRPDGLKQTFSRQIRDWLLAGIEAQNPMVKKERKTRAGNGDQSEKSFSTGLFGTQNVNQPEQQPTD